MSDSPDDSQLQEQLKMLRPDSQIVPKSPLVLAYIGDAVYELAVRVRLAEDGSAPVRTLHSRAAALVRASAQARMMGDLSELLTEEERDIVRRARNTKSNVPRSASVFEYRYSTAFEALLGHLFLAGEFDRLQTILDHVLTKEEKQS